MKTQSKSIKPSGRLLVAALALSACSSSSTPALPEDGGVSDLSTTSVADLAQVTTGSDMLDPDAGKIVSDPLAQQFIGSYAMKFTAASILTIPLVGNMPSTNILLALVDIARDGAGLKITEHDCHVTVTGGSITTTTVPDALPRSIPPSSSEFRAWESGGMTLWRRPETIIPVGVMLTNPATDTLPTMASDTRVWDQDQDGNPGATIMLGGLISGDIYVVQRQRSSINGTLAGTVFKGSVMDISDQAVIGSSNMLLNQNITSSPDPDPTKSTVVFAKLATAYDCDMLVANATTLFP